MKEPFGKLLGKVALVTGSSRGIGRAIALRFAQEGAKVIVTYYNQENKARLVHKEIMKHGGESLCLRLDVTNRSNVRQGLANALKQWGHIDILVNNAGYLQQKPFSAISDEDWDYTLACNLKSVFICSQEVISIFERQRYGCIINISSIGGQIGGTKAPHYAAAKAGVISLTKSMARLYAQHGIRVNAIAPGFIRTDMYNDIISRESEEEILSSIPLLQIGETEDVAAAAVYLASEDAKYVTGHVLNVNGGSFLG